MSKPNYTLHSRYSLLQIPFYRPKGNVKSLHLKALFSPAADSLPRGNVCNSLKWVTKWVDYSNKYGFGYQLSDNTVGVLFNNGTHMSLLSDKK